MRLHTPSVAEDFIVCKRNVCNKKKNMNDRSSQLDECHKELDELEYHFRLSSDQSLQSCSSTLKVSGAVAVEFADWDVCRNFLFPLLCVGGLLF